MAVKAVTLTKTLRYQSEDDPAKGTVDATTFLLNPLSSWQAAQVSDLLASFTADAASGGDAQSNMKVHQAAILAVRFGLYGWENFVDDEERQVEFKAERQNIGGRAVNAISPLLLDRIPMGEIFGMYKMLMDSSGPGEDASKN